jgi:TonB family protein
MSRGKIIAAFGVLFAIYVVASPYITVHQMKSAAESYSGEELSEHIEFPSVRQSLKDQMNAMLVKEMAKGEMKDSPFAALGAAFAWLMVDKIVDTYVTPAGITQLMAGKTPQPTEGGKSGGSSARKPLSDASMSYESLNKFVVKVKGDNGEEGKFVLRRRGMSWKLTEIIVAPEKAPPLSSFSAPSPSPAVANSDSLSQTTEERKEIASTPTTTPSPTPTTILSGAAAKALAVYAPPPQYPYEARSRHITGSGVCVLTVDRRSGNVTFASMAQSIGSPILDIAATSAFRQWRFKPGTVAKVRMPITFTMAGASY